MVLARPERAHAGRRRRSRSRLAMTLFGQHFLEVELKVLHGRLVRRVFIVVFGWRRRSRGGALAMLLHHVVPKEAVDPLLVDGALHRRCVAVLRHESARRADSAVAAVRRASVVEPEGVAPLAGFWPVSHHRVALNRVAFIAQ